MPLAIDVHRQLAEGELRLKHLVLIVRLDVALVVVVLGLHICQLFARPGAHAADGPLAGTVNLP